ncbi:MAG: hypothetical protein QNJ63_00350 [Calothrix sp. MO_192.B10]|nr:hypothetical protein [Calothrix sp. MO_192.B10]
MICRKNFLDYLLLNAKSRLVTVALDSILTQKKSVVSDRSPTNYF